MRIKSCLLPATFLVLSIALCCVGQTQKTDRSDDKSDEVRSGTISGVVVNESGQPLAHAAVYVRPFGGSQQRIATTDNDGSFKVTGLDPQNYLISVLMPAYVTAPRDPDSNQPGYYRVGDSVQLDLIKGGVITGTVSAASGEPLIAVPVRVYQIRDSNGQPSRYGGAVRERNTDDRGVYRVYGLAPGTYLVSAGGLGASAFNINAYDHDAPTYAPSSTQDTAGEITLRAGEEINADIRYRGERGRVVSGVADGASVAGQSPGYSVSLSSIVNGETQPGGSTYQQPGATGFSFSGIADGDYYLVAQAAIPGGEAIISEPRRIKVKGADVTGIELTARPLAALRGRVTLEESKAPECNGKRRPLFAETLITPWHNEKIVPKDQPQYVWSMGGPTTPDKSGEFSLRNLSAGQYRFNIRFVAKYWYLQSMLLQPAVAPAAKAAPANRPVDAMRSWIILRSGDRLSSLNITLASGAASIHGNVRPVEGERIPARLYVELAPAEKEKADDALRFFATAVNNDGTFALNNLAPGRYLLIARVPAANELPVLSKLRLPDEAEARAKLRHEAEAATTEIELKPCQNILDYQLALKHN
jgi:Carboxypeptidase regulatory-like domain